ncbi:MAG: Nramp family divalent metal transporter [Gammaproteobacteria bacterium]|nr:Nramp family divalent metal transporter [Gammaproteobacteria bacterium]
MAETEARARPAARGSSLWLMIGPGLLLAATGVGGGDLATGSIVGSVLGTAVLWAVLVGALLKFVVTEGLTRWQLATGETLLEGAVSRIGPIVVWLFLPYLLLWSFFVGSAQMSATGVTLHAIAPVFDDARHGKIFFGVASGLVGLALVWLGGYRLFERIMRVCIAVMFVTVVMTAVFLWPGTLEVLEGIFVPRIPDFGGEGLTWTVALIGGVGGTLTVLCYGYWLREEGRTRPEDLRVCRIDLGTGYLMTALFGMAMVVVGSTIEVQGEGTALLVTLSDRLVEVLGPTGKWLFLVGTFGAVFSSLLGVWQSVPYLFADCWGLLRRKSGAAVTAVDTRALPYRAYLVVLAIVPMLGLFASFREIQKIYAVTGAVFFPLLALAVLVFNGRAAWVGERFRNRPLTVAALAGVLVFFTWLGIAGI